MKQLEKKHSLAKRWLHWINFPLLTMMIWSGLLIYWANQVYDVKIGGYELFHLFPKSFYDYLGVPFRLAEGLQLHFFFMWLFAANGVLYVLYLIFSGEWRVILPVPGSFKRALLVTLHDLHIVKQLPPQGKYNDAQRIAYTGVILMGAASIELDHLNPELPTYVLCQGGYRSSLGTSILENAGFKEIYNVTGGTKAWMDAGLDTEVSATSCANS